VTLLDLDWDRFGGGWGRIKYACQQLTLGGLDAGALTKGMPRDPSASKTGVVDLDTLHKWTDWTIAPKWIARLEEYDVFFSSPLDLDFSMMRAFPKQYESLESFSMPADANAKRDLLARARVAVLKASGGALGTGYQAGDDERFVHYDRLFLKRGKPVVHMLALEQVTDAALKTGAPRELGRLATRVGALVK
jgi:hypothetical protein